MFTTSGVNSHTTVFGELSMFTTSGVISHCTVVRMLSMFTTSGVISHCTACCQIFQGQWWLQVSGQGGGGRGHSTGHPH